MISATAVELRKVRQMRQGLRCEGGKIIVEQPPVSVVVRVILGVLSLASLVLGLKGCFEFARLLLDFGNGNENIVIGVLVTITSLTVSSLCMWLSLDSGKTLCLNPKTKQAHLTKRYLFKSVEKCFPFSSLEPCFVEQDVDLNRAWYLVINLPGKTNIKYCDPNSLDLKNYSEMWRDKINAMIGKA